MKILGLDLGTRTLGIAISDVTKTLARGVDNFRFQEADYDKAIERVLDITIKEKISAIVLGYPKNMDGTIGSQGKISEMFKTELSKVTDIPIILWDERLSTQQASRNLITRKAKKTKRKKRIDEEAAIFILQSYLDAKK